MSRDIETACDEAVIRLLGPEVKADYSATLLSLATNGRVPAPCPLAFGEGSAKERIKNVLSYRRPVLWMYYPDWVRGGGGYNENFPETSPTPSAAPLACAHGLDDIRLEYVDSQLAARCNRDDFTYLIPGVTSANYQGTIGHGDGGGWNPEIWPTEVKGATWTGGSFLYMFSVFCARGYSTGITTYWGVTYSPGRGLQVSDYFDMR